MARYIKDFQINADPQIVHAAVQKYLQNEGYEYISYDGENVFKKGLGLMTNPTFFKFSYLGNMVRMETWMKYAFFPGVYIGELGVTGFVGCAVKGSWKRRIQNTENILENFGVQAINYTSASSHNNANVYGGNATQILNGYDRFDETYIMNEKTAVLNEENTAFCTGCGARLPEGTIFCAVCGQKRPETTAQAMNVVQKPQPVQQVAPAGVPVSRKEYLDKYVQPSLKTNIKSIAILCYVCAGLTFIVSCLTNPAGIIDALILAGLALGVQLTKRKVWAILLLVFSIVEVILSLIVGAFPIWWLVAGIWAVVTVNKIEKQYKEFIKR